MDGLKDKYLSEETTGLGTGIVINLSNDTFSSKICNLTLLHLVAAAAETTVNVSVPEKRTDPSRWVVKNEEKATDMRKGFTDENGTEFIRKFEAPQAPTNSGFAFGFFDKPKPAAPKSTAPTNVGGGFSFSDNIGTKPSNVSGGLSSEKKVALDIDHDEEYLSSIDELKTAFKQITGDINAQTKDGVTALLLVSKAKIKTTVQENRAIALIENGADVNVSVRSRSGSYKPNSVFL